MSRNIVADTSCLILLNKLGKIDLLKSLFGSITITKIIAEEFGEAVPKFIDVEESENKNYQKILESFLDPGEASAIALALEKKECLLIIDDQKGRQEAKRLNISFTGTLGIFIVAKEKGLINSVTEIINEIQKTNFRIDKELIQKVKNIAGE